MEEKGEKRTDKGEVRREEDGERRGHTNRKGGGGPGGRGRMEMQKRKETGVMREGGEDRLPPSPPGRWGGPAAAPDLGSETLSPDALAQPRQP